MSRKNIILDSLIITAGLAALLVTAPPAFARENCTTAPRAEWKQAQEIGAHAAKRGYTVAEVEREGTCYEVKGFDRNGARIKILYNPQTGEPMARK